MKIRIDLKNGDYILIDVLKENKEWFEFFADLKSKKNDLYGFQTSLIYYPNHIIQLNLKSEWKILHQQIKILKEMGLNIPFDLPKKFPYDQRIHNKLHRIFTYSHEWYTKNFSLNTNTILEAHEPNPIDEQFLPKNVDMFLDAINKINIYVHRTEYFNRTAGKSFIEKNIKQKPDFYLWTKTHVWKDENTWYDELTKSMNKLQSRYLDSQCDVIMSEEIQGKSYLRAFIDNDDPTQRDVSGRCGSFGSFIIESTDNRRKIYESEQFNKWLSRYGILKESLQLEWPLGKVIERNINLKNISSKDFVDIQFIR